MKKYTTTADLLTEIEDIFEGNRPGGRKSPLEEVVACLQRGRHYPWAGIYIAVEGKSAPPQEGTPAHTASAETRSKILISIALAGRERGILAVESERRVFRPEDRVFLERVSDLTARFLAGRGRYLTRQARRMALPGRTQAAMA